MDELPGHPLEPSGAERGKESLTWDETAACFYDRRAAEKSVIGFRASFIRSYRGLLSRVVFPENARVLDLGCGTGELEEVLADQALQMTGIDLSEEALKIARRRNPKNKFQRANMTALPFSNQSFDAVIAITSLEFCEDRKAALHEARRVLKPGGAFYVEVRNADFFLTRLPGPLLKILNYFKLVIPYPVERFLDLDFSQWRRLLLESGFVIEKELPSLRSLNCGSCLDRLKNLLIILSRFFLPLRWQYMNAFLCRAAL